MQIIENLKVKEKLYTEKLDNGLTVMIIPKHNTMKKYIIWSTHFGSIDNHFINPKNGKEEVIPDGVAHFLEHKMFEQRNGTNSLDTLSALGVDANAYTTNDHTAYLYEATNNFYEALDEFMDYVQNPYFTDENVEKEKGIIAEEIKQYDDEVEWIFEEEMKKALPEVDLFIKISEYNKIWSKISDLLKLNEPNACMQWEDRVITTGSTMAYLKIAEGCSNHCTYCAIPKIQGPYISRKIEDIIEEAKRLSDTGIKEIIVIAQDTTKYGIDLYGKPRLAELLTELCKIEGIEWIRFLYAYPESISDELIKVVKENDKICKYFDIPIQHISDKILKKIGVIMTYGKLLYESINKEVVMKKIGDRYTNNIFENIKHIDDYGNEYWYARELSKVLEYKDWRNFLKVLNKAKEACKNSGFNID